METMKKLTGIVTLCIFFSIGISAQESWPAGKTALLLIDIQEFYFPGGLAELKEPVEAAENAALLLDYFRSQGWPVAHVGHISKTQQDFYPSTSPGENEYILMKSEVNAFAGGELHSYLQKMEVTHLIICGMQTHMCVEAATRAAADLGYECTLISDACTTRDLKYDDQEIPSAMVHLGTLATLKGTYARVNTTASLLEEIKR